MLPTPHPPIFPKSYLDSYSTLLAQPEATTTTTTTTKTNSKQQSPEAQERKAQQLKRRQQQAAYSASFSLVKGQLSSLLSTFFMLYMTANSLQIFPLIMLSMTAWTPVRSIFAINSTFARYEKTGVACHLPKFCYFVLNLIAIMAVVWKCNKMDLIPLEWIDYDPFQWSYQVYQPESGGNFVAVKVLIDKIAAQFR